MKHFAVLLLSLATVLTVSGETLCGFFEIFPDGTFEIDGLKMRLMHEAPRSAPVYQSPETIRPAETFPKETEFEFELAGTFVVGKEAFNLTENVFCDEGKQPVHYKVALQSEAGILSNAAALTFEIPIERYLHDEIVIDGKKIIFPPVYNAFNNKILTGARLTYIPWLHGKIKITGTHTCLVTDDRGNDRQTVTVRFFLPNSRQKRLFESEIDFKFSYLPYESFTLDLTGGANLALRNPTHDRWQSWRDDENSDDLRRFVPGELTFSGIPFTILDPKENNGKSALVLRGKERGHFPSEIGVEIAAKPTGDYLYLLHGLSWEKQRGTPVGAVEVIYNDNSRSVFSIHSGIDVGSCILPHSVPNANLLWGNEKFGLYITRFPLQRKPVKQLVFKSNGHSVWIIPAATVSDVNVPAAGK